ncbi:hypothetical protein FUAX_19980 [Fulvitalea axinellae]|uniref:Uncharacterized protein n=1 Tax=Fulvitalea axinellae TaxID=1182444 RepID=A0AAU9D9I1_9BACT|nr:hypothetical protein FUAX_19980 [Fulvitalea axinellae]
MPELKKMEAQEKEIITEGKEIRPKDGKMTPKLILME